MSQRSILITGCSSGIGYDAAHGLRKAGWRVFASCRKPEDCARLRAEGFDSPLIDYADETTFGSALAEVLAATGGTLDALFNNGAYAIPGAMEDISTDAFRLIFQANLFGWHGLSQAVIPVMRAQGHGRIINCSSVLGMVAMQWRGPYNATKFALEGYSDTLRLEMRDTPIHIILISPGPITSLFRKTAIAQFEAHVDWESSARAEQYRTSLLSQLYKENGPGKFELPASAVTQKLIRALDAPRPRARYFVTTPTYIMAFLRRVLPGRWLDALLAKGG